MVSTIADYCGILSLALSIILLIWSGDTRKEVAKQKASYIKDQKSILGTLEALRSNIIDDGLLNFKISSDIRTELLSYLQNYKRILSIKDKYHIRKTLKLLKVHPDKIDRFQLSEELDYFVARFRRKEQKL